jgi:anti-sigma28 factor (negative regulator of flagellin synthesis)
MSPHKSQKHPKLPENRGIRILLDFGTEHALYVNQGDVMLHFHLTTLTKLKERAMEATNFFHIQSTPNIQRPTRSPAGQNHVEHYRQATLPKDTVALSEEGLRLSNVARANAESSKIRFNLVNRIKAEIAAGTYDTPDKMDIAIDRMANRIF